MTRGRSRSIVQRIASDVPSSTEDHLNLGEDDTIQPTTYRTARSKSVDIDATISNGIHSGDLPMFPFTNKESNNVWSQYIETYEYDVVLKPQDIQHINDLQIDNILNFQNNIVRNQQQIGEFIDETDSLLASINTLLVKYNQISSDTIEFDKEANDLLELQRGYTDKYDQINTYLKHFEHLDSITKHLSRSGNHLLHQKRDYFVNEILKSLDESLVFINQHTNFKEAELYGSRFRQCMTRGLTLIRNFLNHELRNLDQSIKRKLARNISIELLIYNEFNDYLKFDNGSFNSLFKEIVARTYTHEEYNGLLREILGTYFDIRLNLLKTYIEKDSNIRSLFHKSDHDLVQTCQDQISYFKKIVEKEYSLYRQFFVQDEMVTVVSEEFYQFLKNLLEPLYDVTRLLILKEHSISNLCQLTTLLQKYYEFDSEEDTASYFAIEVIKYGELFQPILDDAQSRLIFRIQKYVDDKLIKYKPKPEDLKIGNRKVSLEPEKQQVNTLDVEYTENLFPDVYLPLGKALTLLSNIYELINSVVFDDLAHYIVHSCIELLQGEFVKIASAHMGKLDGKLAYLNNLITLRSQINNFDIQYTRTDYSIDFTSGLNDIWQMIKARSFSLNNKGILDLAKKTVPKIINNMIDANLEIELELNNLVTEIITLCSTTICDPIQTAENPLDVTHRFKDNLIMKIPLYFNEFKMILNDLAVTQFLMNNLSNVVLNNYENYYKSLTANISKMDSETRQQISEIMEVDAMYGFINDLLTHVYEEEVEDKPEFNEDILELDNIVEGVADISVDPNSELSPSPGTNLDKPEAEAGEDSESVQAKLVPPVSTSHTEVEPEESTVSELTTEDPKAVEPLADSI
ncbi:uncharacterized protein SPAPADRAFT_138253 [Spathaspora passalidarum NRRL Y-27907]|uniref:Conserved oligomeric Golgi complex subunit 3 n=1 Tax=Spathaspora passalidarum (strain NRRL Y-27907 / 11-Y1) TaxID=619300 RepID=G3AMY5_SPAPN|nr:uncharacterized protein SPAPADRAFT_138253 [Spathaspora passalidarum NRRL Y-27907]EGW32399.1 hypothetical protein SPAPADRAFT_138253 [Spathaspora passalidarum NRRL Y-27907]